MTRRMFLLALAGIGLSPAKTVAAPGSRDLLDGRLELIKLQMRVGESHPKLKAVRQRVTSLEASGARINVTEAEREFLDLFHKRGELRQTYGLDHPDVLTTTRQIGYLASVLSSPVG